MDSIHVKIYSVDNDLIVIRRNIVMIIVKYVANIEIKVDDIEIMN